MAKKKRRGPTGLPEIQAARVKAALQKMHSANGSDKRVADSVFDGALDASTIFRVRTGKVRACLATAERVAVALGMSTDLLLNGPAVTA